MKRIKTLQPNILVGKQFNLQIYGARFAIYRCGGVEMRIIDGGKEYDINFKWIRDNYSVPENIKFKIIYPDNSDRVAVKLLEYSPEKDFWLGLCNLSIKKNNIKTLTGIYAMFDTLVDKFNKK